MRAIRRFNFCGTQIGIDETQIVYHEFGLRESALGAVFRLSDS